MTLTPVIRYVSLGDSFSEGIGDEDPDGLWGWPGRVARTLASSGAAHVQYANMAVRGRTFSGVLPQVDQALALQPQPTLMTICAGGNDLLRPRLDVAVLAHQMHQLLQRVLDAGVRPLLLTPADPSRGLPMGRLIHARGDQLAAAFVHVAHELAVDVVDVSRDTALRAREFWGPDRLHLNAAGHERVAAAVIAALTGSRSLDDAALATSTAGAAGAVPKRPTMVEELQYARDYFLPWVGRRLTGRSSGDGRSARHPNWVDVPAGGPQPAPPA